jgi:hypothetical protein
MRKFIVLAALVMASPAWGCPLEGGPCIDNLKLSCGTMQIKIDGKCVQMGGGGGTIPPTLMGGGGGTIPPTFTYGSDSDRSWHLLTQSEGGTVSLLKDLTKHECEFAMHRTKGEPATDEEVAAEKKRDDARWAEAQDMCANPKKYEHTGGSIGAGCDSSGKATGYNYGGIGRVVQPGDIRSAECFQ